MCQHRMNVKIQVKLFFYKYDIVFPILWETMIVQYLENIAVLFSLNNSHLLCPEIIACVTFFLMNRYFVCALRQTTLELFDNDHRSGIFVNRPWVLCGAFNTRLINSFQRSTSLLFNKRANRIKI